MDNAIMMNDPYQKEDGAADSAVKTIDIFHHLQLSMKNFANNCKCKNKSSFYCVPCKVTLCSKCNYEAHKKHFLLDKNQFELSIGSIDNMFKPLEDCFQNSRIFQGYEELQNELIHDVDVFANELHEEINKLKEVKLKEISLMFENMKKNVTNTIDRTAATKNQFYNYLEKNKHFFKVHEDSKKENTLSEEGNSNTSTFLLNYDLFSLAIKKCREIMTIEQTMKNDVQNFKQKEQDNNKKIVALIQNCLFDPVVKEEFVVDPNPKEPTNDNNEIKHKFTRVQLFQMLNQRKEIKEEEEEIDDTDSSKPSYHFITMAQKLNTDHFKTVNERLIKFSSEIEKFKKEVVHIINKTGNYKEIEKNIAFYETSKEKGADSLFSKRNNELRGKDYLQLGKIPSHYEGIEKVSLDNPILEKFFSYVMTDMYGKYFKMETKELQSSHADLMIKVSEDDDSDFGKVFEGTNEIMIYEKASRKMTKKKVKLSKNPLGYTVFPIGCRTLLIGDKLYITGGKDEVKEYPNVIIYDIKTDTVKRIMDLREPRSYHTMVFNEVFETIMVIGGENKSSVELFDPCTNRWQLLPLMTQPRANSYFYFDKPRGMLYVMFGIEGKIMNNQYHDSIEYLDLTDVNQGWLKMNYNNKTSINLKSFLNVLPLNDELMLLYGGIISRNSSKTVCVLNVPKAEICRLDGKLLEALRNESKKSRRLSAIVSTISLNTN